MVYFIRTIGIRRIKSPFPVQLLGTARYVTETSIHNLFRNYRLKGEWFYASEPLKRFVVTVNNCTDRNVVAQAIKSAVEAINVDPAAKRYSTHYGSYEFRKFQRIGRIRKAKKEAAYQAAIQRLRSEAA
jgi:hypothetical protein